MDFTHSLSNNSLFIYRRGNGIAYLRLYVDDPIITTSSEKFLHTIMVSLSSDFAMKDLGPLSYFLDISITRTSFGLFPLEKKYAQEIIDRAHMFDCKPSSTPVNVKTRLKVISCTQYYDPIEYQCLAGARQCLTFTRPSICYVVQQVCLFMHDPRTLHMTVLKYIIRYVKGTLQFGLHLSPSSAHTLESYTNVDWGGCLDTRRFTSGYYVYLGDNLMS